jgi:sterol desaturase/sphingolipid hydroxylase (fatty acid hydroxylase superfamily)
VVLALISPAIHEVHFFCIHRLIHVPVLYKWVHSVHHNSVNPSPWSSPVDASGRGLPVPRRRLLAPADPVEPDLAMFQLHNAGFGAVNGHIGFDKLELTENRRWIATPMPITCTTSTLR